MSAERKLTAPGESACVQVNGKAIPHNTAQWFVRTNRHPQTNGGAWGWIEGAPGNVCWEDYSRFDRDAASLACRLHSQWLEDAKPIQLKINEARDAWCMARAALDKAELELGIRLAAFTAADSLLESLLVTQGAASHG